MSINVFAAIKTGASAELRAAGFQFRDGLVTRDGTGYFPAEERVGGYQKTPVYPGRRVYQFESGCPAYHGTVVF